MHAMSLPDCSLFVLGILCLTREAVFVAEFDGIDGVTGFALYFCVHLSALFVRVLILYEIA